MALTEAILLPLILLLAAAVAAVLVLGVISMARSGDFNRRYGNLLMRWRVGLQAATVLLFILLLALRSL